MNVTLNDFRSILGKVNDGDIAFKGAEGEEKLGKVNYGHSVWKLFVGVKESKTLTAEENKRVKAAFLQALADSPEAKVLKKETLSQIHQLLGVDANGVGDATPLSRRQIKAALALVDKEATAFDLYEHSIGNLVKAGLKARGGLGQVDADEYLLTLRATSVANSDCYGTAEAMVATLPKHFNGYSREKLTRFCRDNFALIRGLLFETAYDKLTSLSLDPALGHEPMPPDVDRTRLLKKVVNYLMGCYAAHKAPRLPSDALAPLAQPRPVPEGDVHALYAEFGVEAYEKNLDAILDKLGRHNTFPELQLRSFISQLKCNMRETFLNMATSAQGTYAEKLGYVQAELEKDPDALKRMKLVATLAHNAALPDFGADFVRGLGWKLNAKMTATPAPARDNVSLTQTFFTVLTDYQKKASVRTQVSQAIEKLYEDHPKETIDLLKRKFEEHLDACEKANDARQAVYDACFMGSFREPGSYRTKLEMNVRTFCDQVLKEEEARQDALGNARGLVEQEAIRIAKVLVGKVERFKDATDETFRRYGLVALAKAAANGPLDTEKLSDKELVDLLMAEPKEHRTALFKYVEFELYRADSNISGKDSPTRPIRDLLYDGYVKADDLDGNSANMLGWLLATSLANQSGGLSKFFDVDEAKAACESLEKNLKKWEANYPKMTIDSFAPMLAEVDEKAKGGLYQSMLDSFNISFRGFHTTNASELFAALKDAGATFDTMKTVEGRLHLVALEHLAVLNSGSIRGLDECAQRLLGKSARDVTLGEVLRCEQDAARKADPLKSLTGDAQKVERMLSGALRLDEVNLSLAEVRALRTSLRSLETAKSGTSVSLTLANVPVQVTLRPSGELTATVNGLPFHIAKAACTFRAEVEDVIIANAAKAEYADEVRAVLDDNASEATPVLRRRELCTKVIVARTNLPTVTFASVSSAELLPLARAVLDGTKKAEDLVKPAPNAYNSIDMVEMHAAMEDMERATPGSVGRFVQMARLETDKLRSLDERKAVTEEKDVRSLVADLLMNRDTWSVDEEVLEGKAPVRGARIRALAEQYAPELANIRKNPKLLDAALTTEVPKELKGLVLRLAERNPQEAASLEVFAQLETELDQIAKTAMGNLQAKVSAFFKARPADGTPTWQKSFGELAGKTGLDLSTSSGSFAKKILDGYFTRSASIDQRKMFAAVLRSVGPDASEAQIVAALLKGAGPLLQKLLQGLPEASFDKATRDALSDMKSRLPNIASEAIKAQLLELVKSSNGAIRSIEVKRSLGAASVGQALLCVVRTPEFPEVGFECVIKVLRPTAQLSVQREKALFDKLANDAQRAEYDRQYRAILTELDFTREASNVKLGTHVYEMPKVNGGPDASFHAMDLAPVGRPTMGTMVLQKAPGETYDGYLRGVGDWLENLLGKAKDNGEEPIRKKVADGLNGEERTVYQPKGLGDLLQVRLQLESKLTELGKRRRRVEQLVRVWFEEALFGGGFFHGDLHAGNVMIDGDNLTLIDFGNCGRLAKAEHDLILKLLCLATTKDAQGFIDTFRDALDDGGKATLRAALKAPGSTLLADVQAVLEKGYASDALSRILGAFAVLQRRNLALPGKLSSFFQSFARLGGILGSFDDLMTDIRNITTELRLDPPPDTPEYKQLVGKLPLLGVIDELADFAGGHPGTFSETKTMSKDFIDKIVNLKHLGIPPTDDQSKQMGEMLVALKKEERQLLIARLTSNELTLAYNMYRPSMQKVQDLFAKLDSLGQLTPEEIVQLGDAFPHAIDSIVSPARNLNESYKMTDPTFDEIVNATVYDHQKDLTSFAWSNFGLVGAYKVGNAMVAEDGASDAHKERVVRAADNLDKRNVARPEKDRLSPDALTAIKRTVKDFCRPIEVPFAEKKWKATSACIQSFLEALEANRKRLLAAIPGATMTHLTEAFVYFSECEGPQGSEKGPTWLGAIKGLSEQDLAAFQLEAQKLFPETATKLMALLNALRS